MKIAGYDIVPKSPWKDTYTGLNETASVEYNSVDFDGRNT